MLNINLTTSRKNRRAESECFQHFYGQGTNMNQSFWMQTAEVKTWRGRPSPGEFWTFWTKDPPICTMMSSPKRHKNGTKLLKIDFSKEFESRGIPLEEQWSSGIYDQDRTMWHSSGDICP